MNEPALYAKSNSLQKLTVKNILSEFSHLFQWREDGYDSMLDIGCGTGEVTIESILPLLPANSNRLIGCDISDKMIDYAQQHSGHPNVIYHKLDVSGNVDEFLTKFGSFDHAVSFFCLHWVRNQNSAMENISKLLTANGDCLLMIVTWTPLFTVYCELSKSLKWAEYMKDVERFVSPYFDCVYSADDLRVILPTVGFTNYDIREREFKHLYNNNDDFVDFIRSINPFVNRIPASERQDFVIDVATRVMVKNKEVNGMEYLFSVRVLIVYAKKETR